MKTVNKKDRQRGRPRKATAEKAAQFSVRLNPERRLGLELVAREKGLSVSATVELAVNNLLDGELVAGGKKPIKSLVEGVGKILALAHSHYGDEADVFRLADLPAHLMLDENGKTLLMPAELLTPSERFFADVVFSFGLIRAVEKSLSHLRELTDSAHAAGYSVERTVTALEAKAAELPKSKWLGLSPAQSDWE